MNTLTPAQQRWLNKNNKTYPIICKMCPNPTRWQAGRGKFGTYCSQKCSNKDQTHIKEKFKQTNLTKYGVEYPQQNLTIRHKTVQIMQEKYGVNSPQQIPEVRLRTETTNKERYGGKSPACSGKVRTKTVQTVQDRYGVNNPQQNTEIKKKTTQTMQTRYGVNNIFSNKKIQANMRQAHLEKYGSEFPQQRNMLNIMENLEDYRWLFEQYVTLNKTAVQIAEELNVSDVTIGNYLRHCDITTNRYRKYSFKSIQWLDFIMKQEGLYIQHALNDGEFRIPNTRYSTDGFCKVTNTVYEFYGDIFHGNPNKFKPNEKSNPWLGISAGELYNKTIDRENIIRSLGYNLVVIWEEDWDNKQKEKQNDNKRRTKTST